jgi:hypothetical protein
VILAGRGHSVGGELESAERGQVRFGRPKNRKTCGDAFLLSMGLAQVGPCSLARSVGAVGDILTTSSLLYDTI